MKGRFRPRFIRELSEIAAMNAAGRTLAAAPLGASAIQSISSLQTAATQEAENDTGEISTTSTSAWIDIQTLTILIPAGSFALHFNANCQYAHSAANSKVSFRVILYLDDTLTPSVVLGKLSEMFMASATFRSPIHIGAAWNIGSLVDVLPGIRTLAFQAQNNTAGTLRINDGGGDYRFLSAVVFGDATSS